MNNRVVQNKKRIFSHFLSVFNLMIKKFLFVIVFLALTYPCLPQGSTPKAPDPVVFIGNGKAIQQGYEIRQGEKLKISTVDNESSDPHWKILSYRIKIIKQGDITIDEVCLGDSLNSRIVQLIHELPTYSTVVFHNIIATSEVGLAGLKVSPLSLTTPGMMSFPMALMTPTGTMTASLLALMMTTRRCCLPKRSLSFREGWRL